MRYRVLSLAVFLLPLADVFADVMILPPGIDRIALADAIVVGKIIAIEPLDVEVSTTPGSDTKFRFRIAVVSVTETIVGAKDSKELRVGFVPADERRNPIGFGKYPELNFKLDAGKQGLMFLRKHPGSNILHGRLYYDFIASDAEPKENTNTGLPQVSFSKELAKSRTVARLLQQPMEGLKAKDQAERNMTATALLLRYRTPSIPKQKTEAISVEESRLILATLLDQDWQSTQAPTPWNCFAMLGLTDKDGWISPKQINSGNDLRAAARAWHSKHPDYRIQRFVADPAK